MKNLKYLFLTLLGTLTFVACTDDATRDADWSGVKGNGVYFAVDAETSFLLEENQSSIVIPVMRSFTEAAATVNVALTEKDMTGLFAADSKARFEAGKNEGKIEVVFDFNRLETGVNYEMTLTILDADQTADYGMQSLTFSLKYDPWTYVGKAYYRDDIISSVFNVATPYAQVECDLYESDAQEGLYRLANVYNNPYYMAPFFGADPTQFTNNVREGYVVFDISNPNKAYMLEAEIGLIVNSSYGWMTAGSICPENGFEDADYYGTYENNVVTFDTDGLFLFLPDYQGGYTLQTNSSGKTRIVMPGGNAVDPVVEVEFEGVMIDPNSNASAIFNLDLNEDADLVLFAAVDASSDLNAALAAMMDGSLESEEIYEDGEFAYLIDNPGEYVGIFIPVAADDTPVFGSPIGVPFEYSTGGVTPSQFTAEFIIEVDETWAKVSVVPNSEKFNYYWDFMPAATYQQVLAQYESLEDYSLAFFEYVAKSNNVSVAAVMDAYASQGTIEPMTIEGLEAGTEYIAYAFCVNMETGEARSEVTIYEFSTLEPAELNPDYAALLGTWTVTSTSSEVAGTPMSFDVTIDMKKSNTFFDVTGWGGTESAVSSYPVLAVFQAADGEEPALFYIPEQFTNTKLSVQYGNGQLAFFARFYYEAQASYALYGGEGPALVGNLTSSGAGEIHPWYVTTEDGQTFEFTGANYYLYLLDGDYAGQLLGFTSDCAVGPFTMEYKAAAESFSVNNEITTCMAKIREDNFKKVNATLARREYLVNKSCVLAR